MATGLGGSSGGAGTAGTIGSAGSDGTDGSADGAGGADGPIGSAGSGGMDGSTDGAAGTVGNAGAGGLDGGAGVGDAATGRAGTSGSSGMSGSGGETDGGGAASDGGTAWSACGVLGWGLNTIAAIAPGGATAGVATPAAKLEAIQWSSGTPISGISGGYFGASAVAYSSDGTLFAASTNQGFRIWRVSDGTLVQTIPALAGGIAAAISTNGTVAAVGTWTNNVGTLLISRPAGLLTLNVGGGFYGVGTVPAGFSGLVVTPDGSMIIAAYEKPSGLSMEPRAYNLTAWRTTDGSVAWTSAKGVGLTPPGATLTVSNDGAHVGVGLFPTGGGQVLNTADGSVVSSIYGQLYAFSPDGLAILGSSIPSDLVLYRISDGQPVRRYAALPATLLAVAFSDDNYDIESIVSDPSNPSLLQVGNDGTVVGQLARVSATSPLAQALLSPDGAWVATTNSTGGAFQIWNVSSQSIAASTTGSSPYEALAFSPDSQWLAIGANQPNTVTLQPVPTNSEGALSIPAAASAVAYSAAGELIAIGNPNDYSIGLWAPPHWNLPSSTSNTPASLVRTTVANINTQHTGAIYSLAFSPNEQLVASASADGTIKLWNVSDGTLARTISGAGPLAFSPDGSMLFGAGQSASSAPALHVWDPVTGNLIKIFQYQQNFGPVAPVFPIGQGTFLDVDADSASIDIVRLSDWSVPGAIALSSGSVGLSLSANGKLLATFGDAVVRLWCSQ